jgi:glutamate-1-semialdehyde 2,1-aminomutase
MPKADSPPTTPMAMLGVDVAAKAKHLPSTNLEAAVIAAKERFVERNPNSRRLYDEACDSLPGGNTRTLLYSAPFPLCMKKGEAYQMFDEDDHV